MDSYRANRTHVSTARAPVHYPYHRNEGYPNMLMCDFRLLKVASLKRYIRHYGINARPDSTPVELAAAVAKHFKHEMDVSGSVAGEKRTIDGFIDQVTAEIAARGPLDGDTKEGGGLANKRRKLAEKRPWIPADGEILPGAEVAAKVQSEWIHARVVRYVARTKKYEVEDADTESADKSKRYHVPCRWVLPLIIPKHSETLRKQKRVLALFPYTTSFYAGQIVSLESQDRYGVRFDDDLEDGKIVKKRKIPRYFVVPYPSGV
jgi:hypothetical protein